MAAVTAQWILPMVYVTGFLVALGLPYRHWLVARLTAGLGLTTLLLSSAAALFSDTFLFLAADKLGLFMAILVSVLGWVIVSFSNRYLEGELNQVRFVRAMLFTLACVSLLVASQHLLIIVLSWSGTSIGLHYLLTFYENRKTAQIVAHKKFIVSRMADLCLLVAVLLIYNTTGTLSLTGLADFVATQPGLTDSLHLATVLIAMAAILKSAQLPLHGWLLQVMEAPTPVSALLHAGVVNIGGFVLIRLADVVSLAPLAQTLLILVGGGTAVLAGLVMMTRISIKVRLAWSTCAQMGFMLMEIGLGLYELALLHLVAHSLYKAYAFLTAGETVAATRRQSFCPVANHARSLPWYLFAAVQSAVIIALSFALWQWLLPALSLPVAAAFIIALGFAPLLWFEQGASTALVLRGWLQVAGLTQLYVIWHLVFAGLAPANSAVEGGLAVWVMISFSLLYVMQSWLRCHADGVIARHLFPWAYNGFYLDETFTRLTFKFWPARLSPMQAQTLANKRPVHSGDL